MKKLDRVLNIMLVLVVILYVMGKFLATPEERAKELESTAAEAFQTVGSAPEASSTPPASSSYVKAIPYVDTDLQIILNRPGEPVLMLAFTSWCPYCKKLFPDVIALAKEMRPGLQVVAVSIDEDPDKLDAFMRQHPDIDFPVYIASNERERNTFRRLLADKSITFEGGIPFMALLKDGALKEEVRGAVPKVTLRSLVEKHMPLMPKAATGI